MAQSDKIEVLLNPVTFLEADEGWIFGREGEAPSPDEVLKFLCSPEVKSETKNLVRRYRDISGTEGKRLLVAPADHDILTKLVTPLRHGITSYMLGNYLGTIALCGAICEMLAIFWYDLARVKTPQGVMERKTQELMYGRSFEKLNQDRRLNVMRALELLDEDTYRNFTMVRNLRNKYLHYFSISHKPIASDAKKAWVVTRGLLVQVFDIQFENGKIKLNPSLLRYLREKGQAPT